MEGGLNSIDFPERADPIIGTFAKSVILLMEKSVVGIGESFKSTACALTDSSILLNFRKR